MHNRDVIGRLMRANVDLLLCDRNFLWVELLRVGVDEEEPGVVADEAIDEVEGRAGGDYNALGIPVTVNKYHEVAVCD
ncbi:hypothetical protein Nepgr_003279 [Nepenthes gracilis]|uniref:Uncharacterized protein n=1 Tax=Nepenthes gracilis TaxID=150966 RepID=A0AAD3XDK6_NEPGR|nr:hypothetical protein Nepgr_003279 [Nepenthes gracilis]